MVNLIKRFFGRTIKKRAYKSLRKDIDKKRFRHETVNFSTATSVALITCPRSNDDLNKLLGLMIELDSKGKKVANLVFLPTKKKEDIERTVKEYPVLHFISGKDVNIWEKPSGRLVDDFLKREYDVLIDLSQRENFITTYMSAKSKARFRVGKYFEKDTIGYDFMLDQKSHDTDEFIVQLKHYLSIIKNEV